MGYALVAVAAMLWGTGGITAKAIFAHTSVSPLTVGFFRLALSVPILLAVGWAFQGSRLFRIERLALVPLFVMVGLSMAAYQVFYYSAVYRAGVVVATLVTLCLAPILVALISSCVLSERLTSSIAIALVMAIAGTALLVGFPAQITAETGKILAGAALALGSALSYAVLTVVSRALANSSDPFQLIVLGFGGGAVLLMPFAASGGLTFAYPSSAWLLLLYLGLIPTALAYVLFFTGMRWTSATVASIITLLEPLTATVLAWLIFNEKLGPFGLLGAALLLGSFFSLRRGEAGTEPAGNTRTLSGTPAPPRSSGVLVWWLRIMKKLNG